MNKMFYGDCVESMQKMISDGVKAQMCVTSPPYFGLRDYGVDGQAGLEDTPDSYISNMVDVFGHVKNILNDDGVLFVNIGDTYAANRKYQVNSTKGGKKHSESQSVKGRGSKVPEGMKPKDMIGIPWALAFALRQNGWYLRQDIIWHKPNSMPQSVKDRCSSSHEHIFLLSKKERYYFNHEAIQEKTEDGGIRNKRDVWSVNTTPYKGAHCAVFPPSLIEPCILAGSRPGDIVLDPFMGSGTTAQVALQHGRQYIGCELNQEYEPLIDGRIRNTVDETK